MIIGGLTGLMLFVACVLLIMASGEFGVDENRPSPLFHHLLRTNNQSPHP